MATILTNKHVSSLSTPLLCKYWEVCSIRHAYWQKQAAAGNTKAAAKAQALSTEMDRLYREMDRRMLLHTQAALWLINTCTPFTIISI